MSNEPNGLFGFNAVDSLLMMTAEAESVKGLHSVSLRSAGKPYAGGTFYKESQRANSLCVEG